MKKIFPIAFLVFISLQITAQQKDNIRILKTFYIPSPGKWDYIAVGPGNNRLYISHGTQVNILNETTGDSIGVIENTIGVHGIAFDKIENKGFTSNGKINTVTVFDLTTNKILNEIPTGKDPDAIFYEPFSKKIITCNGHANSLSIIDPVKDIVVDSISFEGNPETAVSNDNGKIFVNIENKNEIAVINATTFVVEAYWPLAPGEAPAGLAIDKVTNRLFSGCSDTKQLVIVDASNGKLIDTLPIGAHCDGVVFDTDTKNIFASCGEGNIIVIHESSNDKFMVADIIPTKKGARTIDLDQQTHLMYLPTADFETMQPGDNSKPKIIPGTFQVLVVGK